MMKMLCASMKRLTFLLLIALLSVIALSGIAKAQTTWEYKFPIAVTSESTTNRTYYPVLLGFGADQLINQGYLNADGMDSNMQIGSTSIKYMLSTDNVATVMPSFPSGGINIIDFYTGYLPVQTATAIVTGENGYITVTDDASLELGNNYEIELDGGFSTTEYVVYVFKQGAYIIYGDGNGNITAGIPGNATNQVADSNDNPATWSSETNAYDNNTGTKASSDNIPATSWGDYIVLTYSTPMVIDSLRYYAQWRGAGYLIDIDVWNGDSWIDEVNGVFTDSAWNNVTIEPMLSNISKVRVRFYNVSGGALSFDLYEIQLGEALSVTATGVSAGDRNIVVNQDGVDFKIYVDTVEEDSVATAVSVTNNANNWIIKPLSYMDYYKHTVSSTLIAHYEPEEMISGTTLPDLEGTAQNGTITWGANVDVDVDYGVMVSYASTSSSATGDGGFSMSSSPMPATWFAMGENVENLPFYDMIYNSVSAMDFPDVTEGVQTIYFVIIIGVAFACFLLLAMTTRSSLLAFLAMIIVLFVGSSMTIIPMWIPFAILLTGIGIMYLHGQVTR